MLPRPRPETIADAISMVVSGDASEPSSSSFREPRTGIHQALPPKAGGSQFAATKREVTEAAEQ
jgi:hypothetical protein